MRYCISGPACGQSKALSKAIFEVARGVNSSGSICGTGSTRGSVGMTRVTDFRSGWRSSFLRPRLRTQYTNVKLEFREPKPVSNVVRRRNLIHIVIASFPKTWIQFESGHHAKSEFMAKVGKMAVLRILSSDKANGNFNVCDCQYPTCVRSDARG